MKPLYLEPDEEITSVIEKIAALSDRQIALVSSKNSALFQSLINLKLLAKEAKKLDKELVIIGSNKTTIRLAEQVGLKAYASLGAVNEPAQTGPKSPEQAPIAEAEVLLDGIKVNRYQPPVGGAAEPASEEANLEASPEPVEDVDVSAEPIINSAKDEPMPFVPIPIGGVEPVAESLATEVSPTDIDTTTEKLEEPSSESLPAIVSRGHSTRTEFVIPWRSVIVASILLVFAFVLMIIFLPRAKVTVNFPATPVNQTLTLTAATQSDNSELSLGANLLVSAQEATKTIVATGKKDVGTKATGSVAIKNCEDTTAHALATGSKLTASGKTYVSNSAVTVPAGSFSNGGQTCNSVAVTTAITASEAGEGSNLAGASFVVSGLSGHFTATGTTTGGSTKVVTILAQDDVNKSITELQAQATEKGTAEIKTKAEGQTLLDGANWSVVKTQTVDKKVGDQVDSANLTYAVELSALVFDGTAAQEKIMQAVSKNVTSEQELVIPDQKTPVLTFKSFNGDKSALTFDAAVQGYIVTKVSKTDITKSIARKREAAAKSILTDKFKASSSDIAVTPTWWFGRLPFLAAEITVEFGFSEAATPAP